MQVPEVHFPFHTLGSGLIGAAMCVAGLHSASGEPERERPVLVTGLVLAIARCQSWTSEFATACKQVERIAELRLKDQLP